MYYLHLTLIDISMKMQKKIFYLQKNTFLLTYLLTYKTLLRFTIF